MNGNGSTGNPIADALGAALAGPLKVQGDAGSVEMRSAADYIKAANYFATLAAVANPRRGLRFSRFMPDAAVNFSWRYGPRW